MKKSWILAIDTCCGYLSFALWNPETGESHVYKQPVGRGTSEAFFPELKNLLETAGISLQEISRIAVTRGPGSFTSVRLGLTAAKGFNFALNIPVFGWNTLEVLAKQYGQPCAVWLAAHGKNVFTQDFGVDGISEDEPMSMDITDAIKNATGIVIGDALLKYAHEVKGFEWLQGDELSSIDPLKLAQYTDDLADDDVRAHDVSALYVHPLEYHTAKEQKK